VRRRAVIDHSFHKNPLTAVRIPPYTPTRADMASSLRPLILLSALSLLAGSTPVGAAKWTHGCPSAPIRLTPSVLGATTSPFIDPGHEIGIVLSSSELRTKGGFSALNDGNIITVTFASLFGGPIVLPSFTAAALSAGTLYFTFPDTRVVLGRALAGPVEIRVVTRGRVSALISPRTLVALPPANDVSELVNEGSSRAALATMDSRGQLWIPLSFSRMHPMPMPMPNCPDDAVFTPRNAFAVGVEVRAGMDHPTYPPLRAVRKGDVFLGDFQGNGGNVYGARVRRMPLLRISRGFGVAVCAVNDAANIVLKLRGRRRWAEPGSGFSSWMVSSQPLAITLADVTSQFDVSKDLDGLQFDSFGTSCSFQ